MLQHGVARGQHVQDVSPMSRGGGAHQSLGYGSRTGPRAADGEGGSAWLQLSMT